MANNKKEGTKMEAIQAELISLFAMVIVSIVGIVAQKATAYLKQKGLVSKLESNKELTKLVVRAVEQTYNHLNGNEKLGVAKMELVELAKSKGIKISEKEIDLLIEASVKEMKDSVKTELDK